jgi:hypothetical protein
MGPASVAEEVVKEMDVPESLAGVMADRDRLSWPR